MNSRLEREGFGPGCGPARSHAPRRAASHRAWWIAGVVIGVVGLVTCLASAGTGLDYSEFQKAVDSGNAQSALSLGKQLYTRLAYDGRGQGIYAKTGFLLASWVEAAGDVQRDLLKIYQPADSKLAPGFATMWRQYDYSMSQAAGLVLPEDDAGRFLATYLGLTFDSYAKEILYTAQQGTSQKNPQKDALAASFVVVFLCLGEVEAAYEVPHVKEAATWVAGSEASGVTAGMVKECLSRRRYGAAGLLSKALLTLRPEDAVARQQFIELIGELRKANRTQEAKAYCHWAGGAGKDAAVQSALKLQEAIIAGTDEKNYALAVKMCDEVAGLQGVAAEQAGLARWLAGTFLVSGRDFQEAIRREQGMVEDGGVPAKYKAKAAVVLLTAWGELSKPEKGIEAAMAFLKAQPEGEPEEVADCRQALCMALMSAQRLDEAIEQCKLLIARHPGTPPAKSAAKALEQLGKGTSLGAK